MHSFQPSRGRILFEVLCAVGIAASCGGAWMQTGASALLAAASVATLYGLVHFFDLFRREPSLVVEPQRIDFAADGQADLAMAEGIAEPELAVEELAEVLTDDRRLADFGEAEAELVSSVVAQADGAARPKAPRKGTRRTTAAKRKSKVSDLRPVQEAEAAQVATVEDVPHVHVAPLFEPDPFVRMPRQAFGRRGQI